MTALAIARQRSEEPSLLCVVPTFADADRAIARLARADSGVVGVMHASTRVGAIFRLTTRGVSRMFIDSDVGLKTPVAMWVSRMRNPRLKFSIYEEGVSLFHADPAERPNRFLELLGATLAHGEDPLIDEVWTYEPDEVRPRLPTKRLERIETTLADFVGEHLEMLRGVFWPSFDDDVRAWRGARCCIYLSSWSIDQRAAACLQATSAYTLWKLHPHIRRNTPLPHGIAQVLHASIPAELVLTELAERFDQVEVLHHGTSAERYVTLPNVRFRRVEDALAL